MRWSLAIEPELCWRITLTLIHVGWIGMCVALIAAIGGWLSGSSASQRRYWLNFIALGLLGLSLPVVFNCVGRSEIAPEPGAPVTRARPIARRELPPSPIGIEPKLNANRGIVERKISILAEPESRPDWSRTLSRSVAFGYAAGVGLMLARLVLAVGGGMRLRRSAEVIVEGPIAELLVCESRRLALRAVPVVAICGRVATPVLLGLIRPMILLPVVMVAGLSNEQLAVILSHELAHLRRFDPMFLLIQRALEALLFFHPAAWWLSRRVDREREHCCDDLVVHAGHDRVRYSAALLRVAELSLADGSLPIVAPAIDGGGRSALRRRIERLLSVQAQPAVKLGRPGLLAILLLLICGAGVASALLSGRVEPTKAKPSGRVAQEDQPSVVGRVVDVGGKPVPFVSVGIHRANGALMVPLWSYLTKWTRTDADGRFSMPGVPPGNYKVLPFSGIEIIGQKTRPEEVPAEFREYVDKPGTHRLAKPLPGAFAETFVAVKADEKPAEIEIKAVPHHTLTVRFIDSEGKPAKAWPAAFPIYGSLKDKEHDWDGWFELLPGRTDTMTAAIPSRIKDFWIQDDRDNVWWTWQPGSPRVTHDDIRMKRLDGDRLEIVAQRFRSNSLEIRVKPTAGKLPDDADVSLSYGGSIPRRVGEGVYRLDEMILPGRDCQVMISADGFQDASTKPFRFLEEGQLGVVEVAIKPGVRMNVWKSSDAQDVELKTPEGRLIPQLVEERGPERKIACRAVDASTGKPVADAVVKIEIDRRIREDGDEPFHEKIDKSEENSTRTDADGRFTVSIPEKFINDRTPGARTTLSLTVSEPRYVSFWDSLHVKDLVKQKVTDDFPTFRTVKMKPGRLITGRLVGADGEPLKEVQLYQSFPLTKETMIPDLGETDDDGCFAFNGPVGVALKLEFRAMKSARKYHDIPADKDDLGEIRITPGVRVRGQILDSKGGPVPLLSVTTPAIPQPDNQPNFVETTDREGRFQTDELPAGKYQAVVGDFFYDEEGRKTAFNSRLAPGLYLPVPFEIREGQPAPDLTIRPVPHADFVARLTTTRAKPGPRKDNGKPVTDEESKQAMLDFTLGMAGLTVKGSYSGTPWASSASYLCFDDEMQTCRIRVPIGLVEARLDFGTALQRFRIGANGPELFGPAYRMAKVDAGVFEISLRRYRETTLKIELTTLDGKPADASKLEARYVREPAMREAGVIFDGPLLQPVVEKSNARLSVLPDEEIRLTIPGSDPIVVKLSEGESRTIKKTVSSR